MAIPAHENQLALMPVDARRVDAFLVRPVQPGQEDLELFQVGVPAEIGQGDRGLVEHALELLRRIEIRRHPVLAERALRGYQIRRELRLIVRPDHVAGFHDEIGEPDDTVTLHPEIAARVFKDGVRASRRIHRFGHLHRLGDGLLAVGRAIAAMGLVPLVAHELGLAEQAVDLRGVLRRPEGQLHAQRHVRLGLAAVFALPLAVKERGEQSVIPGAAGLLQHFLIGQRLPAAARLLPDLLRAAVLLFLDIA